MHWQSEAHVDTTVEYLFNTPGTLNIEYHMAQFNNMPDRADTCKSDPLSWVKIMYGFNNGSMCMILHWYLEGDTSMTIYLARGSVVMTDFDKINEHACTVEVSGDVSEGWLTSYHCFSCPNHSHVKIIFNKLLRNILRIWMVFFGGGDTSSIVWQLCGAGGVALGKKLVSENKLPLLLFLLWTFQHYTKRSPDVKQMLVS